jgi:hypothetical protein
MLLLSSYSLFVTQNPGVRVSIYCDTALVIVSLNWCVLYIN